MLLILLIFFYLYDFWYLWFNEITPLVSTFLRYLIVRMKVVFEDLFQSDIPYRTCAFLFFTFLSSILKTGELIFLYLAITLSFLVLIVMLVYFTYFPVLNMKISQNYKHHFPDIKLGEE